MRAVMQCFSSWVKLLPPRLQQLVPGITSLNHQSTVVGKHKKDGTKHDDEKLLIRLGSPLDYLDCVEKHGTGRGGQRAGFVATA